jgi:hypothetical protein
MMVSFEASSIHVKSGLRMRNKDALQTVARRAFATRVECTSLLVVAHKTKKQKKRVPRQCLSRFIQTCTPTMFITIHHNGSMGMKQLCSHIHTALLSAHARAVTTHCKACFVAFMCSGNKVRISTHSFVFCLLPFFLV